MRILVAAVVIFAASGSTFSGSIKEPGLIQHPLDEQLAQQELKRAATLVTYYYRQQDPEVVPSVMRTFYDAGVLADERNHPGLLAFLTRVFAENPDRASALVEQMSWIPAPESLLLWAAVRWSGVPGGDELITKSSETMTPEWQQAMQNVLKWNPPSLLDTPPMSSVHLDMMWSSFFATGDEQYVERIISGMKGQEAQSQEEYAVSEAAAWSIFGNCFQHERVLDICRKKLAEIEAPAHDQLADILASVEMSMGFEPSTEPSADVLKNGE